MASGATQQYAQIASSLRVLTKSGAGRVVLLAHSAGMRRVARLASTAFGKNAPRRYLRNEFWQFWLSAFHPSSLKKIMATLTINGKQHQMDLSDDTPLLWALRDHLGMTGTKFGCGMALCGACTVHLNGQAIRSCITPVSAAVGQSITTIEAMADDSVGQRVQQAWTELGVPQCGYCQSGQIMSATALLKTTPHPTDAEIESAMSGNICRCGTYTRIRAAIKQASAKGTK